MKNSEYMLIRSGDLNCPFHINPELEFVYVKKGRISVFYDSEPAEVTDGEAALVLPFSIHRFEMSPDTEAKVFMFSNMAFGYFDNIECIHNKQGKFKVADAAADFAEYISLKPKLTRADIRAAFYALFSEADIVSTIQHMMSDDCKKVMEYIYRKISEPLSLDILSSELGMGKKKISDILKSSQGVGVRAFISNVRIEKAKIQLISTDKTVTEIAFECGFGSVRTFNRVFAGKTGCTPGEYRKSI